MFELLKIIHFLSFSLAIGASIANLMVGRRISEFSPEAMPNIGAIRLAFSKATTHGLILLWITGILMVLMSDGAYQANMFFVARWLRP